MKYYENYSNTTDLKYGIVLLAVISSDSPSGGGTE